MLLNNKVAVITGASGGIGGAIALKMARQGAMVVLNFSSNAAKVEELFSQIKKEGGEGLVVQGDVTSLEDCKTLAKRTLDKFDKIDILVNNAGITRDNILIRMKEEEWQQVIDTNLKGVFNCTKSFVRSFIKQKSPGTIINISSVVGVMGGVGQANYAAAKAGIIGFTKSLARELASRDITVNAIAPGFIDTQMTAVLPAKVKEDIKSIIPLGRTGTPDEVADLTVFLAAKGRYITGQVICIDGGLST